MTIRNKGLSTQQTLTWDEENRLEGITGGGLPTEYYYFNGQRVAMHNNSPSTNGVYTYLHSDHLASTVFVAQSGTTLTTTYYYPYGGNRGGAFSNLTTKRFTGQYHESSLPGGEGLSYYNARWYDPKLGRFLSADTIVPGPANPQALNRYCDQ